MVEQSLRQLDDDQRGRLRMTMVAAPIATGEVAIPDIKLVGTPLKVVSQLVDWVVPKNVYTLSGFVQKPGSRGAGLTLTLANNRGMIKGNVTLWQEEFDPKLGSSTEMEQATEEDSPADKDPTGYYLLAEPAAIWLFFQLKSLTQDRGDRNGKHTKI